VPDRYQILMEKYQAITSHPLKYADDIPDLMKYENFDAEYLASNDAYFQELDEIFPFERVVLGAEEWNRWVQWTQLSDERWLVANKKTDHIYVVLKALKGFMSDDKYFEQNGIDFCTGQILDEQGCYEFQDISCGNFIFPSVISFKNAVFRGNAWFDGAVFTRDAWFDGVVFKGNAWFDGATFTRNVRFDRAIFMGDTGFDGARFIGGAWFDEVNFTGDLGFDEVVCEGDVRFFGANFIGNAWFDGVTFVGNARYDKAVFTAYVGFNRAVFIRDAGFEEAVFASNAGFEGTTFTGSAWFEKSIFKGNAWFGGASFSAHARFDGTSFMEDAWFDEVNFAGNSRFIRAIFAGDARFNEAVFLRGVRFDGANFTGIYSSQKAMFWDCAFWNDSTFITTANFMDSYFLAGSVFKNSKFNAHADFDHVRFGKKEGILKPKQIEKYSNDIQAAYAAVTVRATSETIPDFKGAIFEIAPNLGYTEVAELPLVKTKALWQEIKQLLGDDSKKFRTEDADAAAKLRVLGELANRGHHHLAEKQFFRSELLCRRGHEAADWREVTMINLFELFSGCGLSFWKPIRWWVAVSALFGFFYRFLSPRYDLYGDWQDLVGFTVANSLPVIGIFQSGDSRASRVLFGEGSLPFEVGIAAGAHTLLSTIFLFFALLAIRNYFKLG